MDQPESHGSPAEPSDHQPPTEQLSEGSHVDLTTVGSRDGVDKTERVAVPEPDERQERLQHLKSIMPPPRKKHGLPLSMLIIGVVIIIVVAAIIFIPYNSHKNTPSKAATTVAPTNTSSSTTAHYISNGTDLNLDFDYPSNWSVTPASGGNANDQTITLNSPLTTIISASGASTTGKVTVQIRPATAQLSELGSAAVAGQNSVQIAYAKPTAAQYQYPYLSFIHLAGGADASSAFEEVMITGTTQSNRGDSMTADSISVDPVISATIYSCATNSCTGSAASPLSITNDIWQSNPVLRQTLALFESLQLN